MIGAREEKSRSFVAAMRARGMSGTAIRRALGLNEREAVAAGIVEQRPGPASPPAAAEIRALDPAPRGRAADPRRTLMADVLAAVAQAGGIDRADILGDGRKQPVASLRQLAMLMIRERCSPDSMACIGVFFRRDHTTVLHGCRAARARLAGDAVYRQTRRLAERALDDSGLNP